MISLHVLGIIAISAAAVVAYLWFALCVAGDYMRSSGSRYSPLQHLLLLPFALPLGIWIGWVVICRRLGKVTRVRT